MSHDYHVILLHFILASWVSTAVYYGQDVHDFCKVSRNQASSFNGGTY